MQVPKHKRLVKPPRPADSVVTILKPAAVGKSEAAHKTIEKSGSTKAKARSEARKSEEKAT